MSFLVLRMSRRDGLIAHSATTANILLSLSMREIEIEMEIEMEMEMEIREMGIYV